MNYLMWIMVGFAFSKVIRSRFRGWWLQYNYILSAALDAGLALCTIFIFLTLQLKKVDPPSWWGNNVVSSTLVRTPSDSEVFFGTRPLTYSQDQQGAAVRKVVEDGQTFGPPPGSW
jgi:hypothetical protein